MQLNASTTGTLDRCSSLYICSLPPASMPALEPCVSRRDRQLVGESRSPTGDGRTTLQKITSLHTPSQILFEYANPGNIAALPTNVTRDSPQPQMNLETRSPRHVFARNTQALSIDSRHGERNLNLYTTRASIRSLKAHWEKAHESWGPV